jgi:hypothetical protein
MAATPLVISNPLLANATYAAQQLGDARCDHLFEYEQAQSACSWP